MVEPFCDKCGEPFQPGQQYCLACGAVLNEKLPAREAPSKPAASSAKTSSPPSNHVPPAKATSPPPQPPHQFNKRYAVYGFVALILLGVIAAIALSSHPANTAVTKYKNVTILSKAATFNESDSPLTIVAFSPPYKGKGELHGEPYAGVNITVKNRGTSAANGTYITFSPWPAGFIMSSWWAFPATNIAPQSTQKAELRIEATDSTSSGVYNASIYAKNSNNLTSETKTIQVQVGN